MVINMKTTTISNAVKLAIHKQPSQAETDLANHKQEELRKHLTESVNEMMRRYFVFDDNKKGA